MIFLDLAHHHTHQATVAEHVLLVLKLNCVLRPWLPKNVSVVCLPTLHLCEKAKVNCIKGMQWDSFHPNPNTYSWPGIPPYSAVTLLMRPSLIVMKAQTPCSHLDTYC